VVLMLCHCSNAEMSKKLHLGCVSVGAHVKSVLRKVGLQRHRKLLRSHRLKTVNPWPAIIYLEETCTLSESCEEAQITMAEEVPDVEACGQRPCR